MTPFSTCPLGRLPFALLFSLSLLLSFGCQRKASTLIWTQAKTPAAFPEASLNLPSTGVCFSGGGTRAMNCAIGQMRGLQAINLWDSIGYISAVSGGSWASTIFTYYREGADNDKQLLGNIISPGSLTMDTLEFMPKGFMGEVITFNLEKDLFRRLGADVLSFGLLQKMDFIWIDGIGHTYLKPFGLYHPQKPKYFTLNNNSRDEILNRNPKLSADDFITVHHKDGDIKRPYLIVNSSLLAPAKDLPIQNPENLSVFNYTPLYIGSNQPLRVRDENLMTGDTIQFDAGGGFIEPFAFGGNLLKRQSLRSPNAPRSLTIKLAKRRFQMVDATGTSSAAFGAAVSSSSLAQLPSKYIPGFSLNHLIPEEEYWPYKKDGSIGLSQKYRFTDGGNLENFGLITLLQRGVKKIVVFINTNSPLLVGCHFDDTCPPLPEQIDSDVYPLFGYPFGNLINNQVFSKADFKRVYEGLSEAKVQGKTVMTLTDLTTVKNDWWGIPAGQQVEVLWVYNEQVLDWEKQLPPKVREQIALGAKGAFPDFPSYKLFFENGFSKGISLTRKQVNLLYQLSAWNVYSNEDVFDFLR